VAISSTARHALPDPCSHPVRAADRHHTLVCKTRAAEQPSQSAVCAAPRSRYAALLGETRRGGDDYNDYANYIVFRIGVFTFGFCMAVSPYFLRSFREPSMTFQKYITLCGIAYHLAKSPRFTEIFPEIRPKCSEIFRDTENTRTFLKLR